MTTTPTDAVEAVARTYFECGFIAAVAWGMTKPDGARLNDDVIDHAWAHRDEGMDEEDMLPAMPPALPEQGWRPIAEAPRDGSQFLAGRWYDGIWIFAVLHGWADKPFTHYRPLPAPPESVEP